MLPGRIVNLSNTIDIAGKSDGELLFFIVVFVCKIEIILMIFSWFNAQQLCARMNTGNITGLKLPDKFIPGLWHNLNHSHIRSPSDTQNRMDICFERRGEGGVADNF